MKQHVMMNNLGLQDVNPLVCGTHDCLPGDGKGPAARDYFLLHYIFGGRGVFETPRGSYTVTKGQIFVMRPQEVCTYTADMAEPWSYSWIGFACRFPLGEVLQGDVVTAPECAHIFRSLTDAGHIEAGREWYICGKTYELLALLAAGVLPKKDDASQYVRMAVNYIESQYMLPIKIAQLARYLSLNRSYFSKIFRQHTGKSPQEYLVDFRLQKAAELITTQGLPPGEVAQRVGYTDALNFSRMFRRRYGVSPSSYRDRQS